jgi:hypothetical protein
MPTQEQLEELQDWYAEAQRRDLFRKNEEVADWGHEARRRGLVNDPTQGGLFPEKPTAGSLPSLASLTSKHDLGGLIPEARTRLGDIDAALGTRGLKGTITSARRSGTIPSLHNEGRAVDIVLPGNMTAHARWLQEQGFDAHFEREGQRNPNGSVATGDHIHVSLRPSRGLIKPTTARRPVPQPMTSPQQVPKLAAAPTAAKPTPAAPPLHPTEKAFLAANERWKKHGARSAWPRRPRRSGPRR